MMTIIKTFFSICIYSFPVILFFIAVSNYWQFWYVVYIIKFMFRI